ncbi:MAG: chromate efflux transporter [Candidatus Velthaea sp.]|jgi:chromate transporter
MRNVFLTFLRLGLTSFGGPIAHIGYFRREFVERRGWLDERLFAHIVAFCSVLPGPTSSQVGMIVGLVRAGPLGAIAAWLGFTLPSALVMALFGAALTSLESEAQPAPAVLTGMLAGLGAAATAIVAVAVLGMAKSQCPDRMTRTIAAGAAVLALALAPGAVWQWVPIVAGALAGALLCPRAGTEAAAGAARASATLTIAIPLAVSRAAALLFVVLAVAAGLVANHNATGFLLATLVRAGALVFGGGHVVLPLLQSLVPAGLISGRDFYAGYGAAQAVPGPLFTFAAFLGMANHSPLHGPWGAVVATVLIFAPSFMLIFALLPILDALRANPAAAGALRGANAAVVGLLAALLYSPLLLSLGTSLWRVAIAVTVFTLVAVWNAPPWLAVALAAALGAAAAAARFAFV